jgi:soluble lytic murein transglycosylase
MPRPKIGWPLGLGALALLVISRSGGSRPGSVRYPVPSSDWGKYRHLFEKMSRKSYSSSEIDRIIKYEPIVIEKAQAHGVNPSLVNGIIHVESRFRPDAESPVGAKGMMQFMPGTWSDMTQRLKISADPFDPIGNIEAGSYYIGRLISAFDSGGSDPSDTYKAIASYNWGIGNVKKAVKNYGNDWLSHAPSETRKYVNSVILSWQDFEDVFLEIGS